MLCDASEVMCLVQDEVGPLYVRLRGRAVPL
jgi:hypothetical protein